MSVADRVCEDPESSYLVGYRTLATSSRAQQSPDLIDGKNGLLVLTEQYESVFPGNADIDPLPNTATDQHAQQKSRRRCRGTYTYVECAPSNENEKESLILEGNSCRRLPS